MYEHFLEDRTVIFHCLEFEILGLEMLAREEHILLLQRSDGLLRLVEMLLGREEKSLDFVAGI